MPTDDFVTSIALEALRARIPTADDPVRVEHVDGVICDGLDEELEALLVGHRA